MKVSILPTPALSTMSIFSVCMKVQILIVTWLWFLPKFFEAIERLQSKEFSLVGHKVKVFLGGGGGGGVTTIFMMTA